MLKVENINTRYYLPSYTGAANPADYGKKEKSDKVSGTKLAAGVAAAAIAIAGIRILKGRGNVMSSSTLPYSKPEIINIFNGKKNLMMEAEKDIRSDISKLFQAFRENGENAQIFEPRIKTVEGECNTKIAFDKRELEDENFDAVISLIESYSPSHFNPKGVNFDVKRLDSIINDAKPLEKQTSVYFCIRTQKTWDEFKSFDFTDKLKKDAIFKDEDYVLTSRVYDDFLAQADPVNYKDHEDCGYLVRLWLPEKTKGIDCRRCSGKDSDKGLNALFILPKNSKFQISQIDDDTRIIDANYII